MVSGGHSHLIEVLDYTKFRIIGRTRDDAAGEAFDKAARAMGFPYPGGVFLDKASHNGDPAAYKLPRPRVEGSPYDGVWGVKISLDDPKVHNPNEWQGENLLGFVLMETRDRLREAAV